MFRFGADYYPEHWPEERWAIDARLMQDAGFNTVRLAEFAWSRLEPSPGEFDFDWLDRSIEVLADHDIQVVLGTPTASPAPWVMELYPDCVPTGPGRPCLHLWQSTRVLSDPCRLSGTQSHRHRGHGQALCEQPDSHRLANGQRIWSRCFCPTVGAVSRIGYRRSTERWMRSMNHGGPSSGATSIPNGRRFRCRSIPPGAARRVSKSGPGSRLLPLHVRYLCWFPG